MEKLSSYKTRNSNIELLRVLSMLMIVAYHYSIYGFYAEDLMYTNNKLFVDIFGMGGKIGTDLFVLISGYYMVNSRFTFKKILTLLGQVWFYSIGALLIFFLLKGEAVLNGEVLKISLFPILSGHYWFITYYVILLFCSQYLNILVKNLSKRQHLTLCILLFSLCSFLPEFLHIKYADGSLPLFIALYVSAAYCRLHLVADKKLLKISTLALLLLVAFCVMRIVVTDVIGQQNRDSDMLAAAVGFMGAYSPFAFLIAVFLLVIFSKAEGKHNRAVAFLGSVSFGVYLFHDNALVREILWQNVLHTAEHATSNYLVIHAVLSVFGIFAAGAILEVIRQIAVAPLWEKCVLFAESGIELKGKTDENQIAKS